MNFGLSGVYFILFDDRSVELLAELILPLANGLLDCGVVLPSIDNVGTDEAFFIESENQVNN